MSTAETKRWSTAVHEAGHAVMTVMLGGEVCECEVSGPREGVTRTKGKMKPSATVMVTLSGLAAEKMMRTGLSAEELLEGAHVDLLAAMAVTPPEVMGRVSDKVASILSENTEMLIHVACELHVRGGLSGEELVTLMNEWAE